MSCGRKHECNVRLMFVIASQNFGQPRIARAWHAHGTHDGAASIISEEPRSSLGVPPACRQAGRHACGSRRCVVSRGRMWPVDPPNIGLAETKRAGDADKWLRAPSLARHQRMPIRTVHVRLAAATAGRKGNSRKSLGHFVAVVVVVVRTERRQSRPRLSFVRRSPLFRSRRGPVGRSAGRSVGPSSDLSSELFSFGPDSTGGGGGGEPNIYEKALFETVERVLLRRSSLSWLPEKVQLPHPLANPATQMFLHAKCADRAAATPRVLPSIDCLLPFSLLLRLVAVVAASW